MLWSLETPLLRRLKIPMLRSLETPLLQRLEPRDTTAPETRDSNALEPRDATAPETGDSNAPEPRVDTALERSIVCDPCRNGPHSTMMCSDVFQQLCCTQIATVENSCAILTQYTICL